MLFTEKAQFHFLKIMIDWRFYFPVFNCNQQVLFVNAFPKPPAKLNHLIKHRHTETFK